MPTSDEIKRRFHRYVQEYAATHATPIWGRSSDEWARANREGAERLAEHILSLRDDDPRLVTIAAAYTARSLPAEGFPTAMLAGWLAHLGSSDASGVPNDPNEFVTRWLEAEMYSVKRQPPR